MAKAEPSAARLLVGWRGYEEPELLGGSSILSAEEDGGARVEVDQGTEPELA